MVIAVDVAEQCVLQLGWRPEVNDTAVAEAVVRVVQRGLGVLGLVADESVDVILICLSDVVACP